MRFKKYSSIDNTYQQDLVEKITEQGFADRQYVVQEKVHGANLSMATNGLQIVCAKRTELLTEQEDFFNFQTIASAHRKRLLAVHTELSSRYGVRHITVFGELFGGGYPHPKTPSEENAKLVQRGIYYCPHNDFYAFDILIDGEKYLDEYEASSLFQQFEFIHAKPLFKGSLNECLIYPNTFTTTLPAQYGLPALDGNLCEGVVIRPVQSAFLHNGSRIILKNKNEKWAENNNLIDTQLLRALFKQDVGENETVRILCEEVYKLITENRLNNLLSKIGKVDMKKDLGKIVGMYCKDALDDLKKEFGTTYNSLAKNEQKFVNKFLNTHASKLIAKSTDHFTP